MVFSSDTFTDTSGTNLTSHTGEVGASWTALGLGGGSAAISDANRARPNSGGSLWDIWYSSGSPATAEYDVEGDLYVASNIGAGGIAGRVYETDNAYFAYFNSTVSEWRLFKIVSGSYTLLGSYSQSLSTSTSYAILLEIRDATKKVYIDTVERISSTDNAVASAGKAGVWLENGSDSTGYHIDNFVASDVAGGGGAAVPVFAHHYRRMKRLCA